MFVDFLMEGILGPSNHVIVECELLLTFEDLVQFLLTSVFMLLLLLLNNNNNNNFKLIYILT